MTVCASCRRSRGDRIASIVYVFLRIAETVGPHMMSRLAMSTPHDGLFKSTFSQIEHARSELQSLLPAALGEHVQWSTLDLVSGEFLDPQLAHLQSDLLFTVDIGARSACLYVLFEHQSTVDRFMPLRLLRYMTRVWERFASDHPGRLYHRNTMLNRA